MVTSQVESTDGASTDREVKITTSPSGRHLFASKANTAYKWQRARDVVGALEVKSHPALKLRDPLQAHYVEGRRKTFDYALKIWEKLKLRDDFVRTCESLPKEACCCGLLGDQDGTIKNYISMLNEDWCKKVNKKFLHESAGVKVDTFLWNWQNASGKAETNIMLIRFYELSSYRFRRASKDNSLELDLGDLGSDFDVDSDDEGENVPAKKKMDRS